MPDEPKLAWLTELDDTLATQAPEDEFSRILAGLIKEYLLCDDDGVAATFATRFDDLYAAVYEPRFNGYSGEKKGWTGFLHAFYAELFRVSGKIQYDDPQQGKVIQLLRALRKLPPRAVKLFVQSELGWLDAEVWRRDPLLPSALLINMPREDPTLETYNFDDPLDVQDFDEDTTLWINSNAFWARCTGAGFDEESKFRFTHAGSSIATGLEEGYPKDLETKLDCHVMAAAQFLLHAGDVINDECVRKRYFPPRYWVCLVTLGMSS
ncbi:hypothetical protein C8A05DRAFT_19710 [Staphylotrichum tortipilum]|uniref:Uncharacterized protein n=1 Tax=Staphylotrichum tortipilum TaxID=2831512 RepID=A0AAN6RNV0_9PEZI|nr:hypothetical protein C8A05DRAFT_19710 [Staphylotrichum longicolle]